MKTKQQQTESMNIRIDDLLTIEPITDHQHQAFNAWRDGDHLALMGTAGTGKTFLAMYLALEQVLDRSTPYDLDAFTGPYRAATAEMFEDNKAYEKLIHNDYLKFESTSYIRGVTFDHSIILVDECQNLNFHELDSVITRVGQGTKIIFSGDYKQSDFKSDRDKKGINTFLQILDQMKNFSIINFTWEDIVRSDFVRDYIMTKEWMDL
jgi:phosphate starvation-inducible PhoH-like protein